MGVTCGTRAGLELNEAGLVVGEDFFLSKGARVEAGSVGGGGGINKVCGKFFFI